MIAIRVFIPRVLKSVQTPLRAKNLSDSDNMTSEVILRTAVSNSEHLHSIARIQRSQWGETKFSDSKINVEERTLTLQSGSLEEQLFPSFGNR